MRVLGRNKQKLQYSLLVGEVPEVETYVDEYGNEYTDETGGLVLKYSEPIEFLGNISMSGSDTEVLAFGIDTSEYDAVLVMPLDSLPITETSLIWHKSEPKYKDEMIDSSSADYRVVRIIESLGYCKYVLRGITH